eukprot:3789790-Amphidinium_carterae.1
MEKCLKQAELEAVLKPPQADGAASSTKAAPPPSPWPELVTCAQCKMLALRGKGDARIDVDFELQIVDEAPHIKNDYITDFLFFPQWISPQVYAQSTCNSAQRPNAHMKVCQ